MSNTQLLVAVGTCFSLVKTAPLRAETVTRGPYRSVQVNVAPDGQNVFFDAANEPSLAVDPTDRNRIVIGWRQFDLVVGDSATNFRQAGYAYSHDGGQTWTSGVLDSGQFRSDPVLAADGLGIFYYYSLSTLVSCELFISSNGGVSWSAPISAFGGDKAWMTVDRTRSTGRGNIYTHWNKDFTSRSGRDFSRSIDGGFSFEDPIGVPSPDMKWGTLDVGPDGTLYLAGTRRFGSGPLGTRHVVARSTNARDASAVPVTFDFVNDVDLGGRAALRRAVNPDGLLGQVWVATDHSSGPTRGNVYVLSSVTPPAAPGAENPDEADVNFIRSIDRGATWSDPVRVHDDLFRDWQWFGTMSVAPNGRIDAIWNDTRSHPAGCHVPCVELPCFPCESEMFHAFSTNAGRTWSRNVPVTPAFDSRIGWPPREGPFGDQQWKIGDYCHAVSDCNGVNVAYAATFNGEQDVYFLRIPVGKMYWTVPGRGEIRRANLDGSDVEILLTGLSNPTGIAIDPDCRLMYWCEAGADPRIRRTALDRTSAIKTLVSAGLMRPQGIALDLSARKMYWTDAGNSEIKRAALTGNGVKSLLGPADGLRSPIGIALDVNNGQMYWADFLTNKIQRANLDGSEKEDLVTSGPGQEVRSPSWLALNFRFGVPSFDHMYWTETDLGVCRIRRALLEPLVLIGDTPDNRSDLVVIKNGECAAGIALDTCAERMYWAAGSIVRAEFDGASTEPVVTGSRARAGLALDLRAARVPAIVSCRSPFVVADAVFDAIDWTHVPAWAEPPAPADFVRQETTGGNPGAFQRGEQIASIPFGILYVAHIFTGAGQYDPKTRGAFVSLDVEYDYRDLGGSGTTRGVLLRQANRTYIRTTGDAFRSEWTRESISGLSSQDPAWRQVGASGVAPGRPDFSEEGAPIELGYFTFTASAQFGTVPSVWGMDNFRVTFVGAPQASPELVEIAGVSGPAPDTFISPRGEDVAFTTVDLDLSADATLAAGAGLTLTSNGGGNHTLTLGTPVPVGECVTLTFDVADLATGAVATITITLCHLPLDVNQDGTVNIADITAWGAEFNGDRRAALVDTNGDGNVNVQDATRVGDMWFGRPPATRVWNGESVSP